MADKVEEKIDRIEKAVEQTQKDIKDLVEIVGSIATNMVTKGEFEEFREETKKSFEIVTGKVNGVQRGLDSAFERHSGLEVRVSKIEAELHPVA